MRFTRSGYFLTRQPMRKNVPFALYFASTRKMSGVVSGFGPSSNVNAMHLESNAPWAMHFVVQSGEWAVAFFGPGTIAPPGEFTGVKAQISDKASMNHRTPTCP